MSSNIRVKRICQHCGDEFIAKRTNTKYCSHKCNSTAYKLKIKNEKIQRSNNETDLIKTGKTDKAKDKIIQSDLSIQKEFLSVNEVAELIGCTRQSIYKMINSGRLKASNLLVKKTVIKRSEIDKMFEQTIQAKLSESTFKKVECYYMEEISVLYGIASKTVYSVIKRYKIDKIQVGAFVYVLKKDIHNIFGKPQN